ncbi:MAG: Lrp/AsnC family transcriptional regulator [Pseudomonadota bacterium]
MTSPDEAFDTFDLKILRTLGARGSLKNVDLADAVGLSPSACHQRTARLKKLGVLKGFTADIDIAKVTPVIRVLTLVMLEKQDISQFQIINNRLPDIPQIVRAHRTSGDFDYAFETVAPDFDAYLLILKRLVEGVEIKQYQSRIMQEVLKIGNATGVLEDR